MTNLAYVRAVSVNYIAFHLSKAYFMRYEVTKGLKIDIKKCNKLDIGYFVYITILNIQ